MIGGVLLMADDLDNRAGERLGAVGIVDSGVSRRIRQGEPEATRVLHGPRDGQGLGDLGVGRPKVVQLAYGAGPRKIFRTGEERKKGGQEE